MQPLRVYMPPTQGGAIAQLGERLNGIQEVVGSIPIGSTMDLKNLAAGLGTLRRRPGGVALGQCRRIRPAHQVDCPIRVARHSVTTSLT
jgi:hypothetical protein